jgi:hypothetical protein
MRQKRSSNFGEKTEQKSLSSSSLHQTETLLQVKLIRLQQTYRRAPVRPKDRKSKSTHLIISPTWPLIQHAGQGHVQKE